MNTVLGSGAVCGRRKIFFPASAMELVFLVVHQHREQRGVQEGRERGVRCTRRLYDNDV